MSNGMLQGTIAALESFLDEHGDAGIVAALLFPDMRTQESCRSFPTVRGMFLYLSTSIALCPRLTVAASRRTTRMPKWINRWCGNHDSQDGAGQAGMSTRPFFLFMEM